MTELSPEWLAGYDAGYKDGENSVQSELLLLFDPDETYDAQARSRVRAWVMRLKKEQDDTTSAPTTCTCSLMKGFDQDEYHRQVCAERDRLQAEVDRLRAVTGAAMEVVIQWTQGAPSESLGVAIQAMHTALGRATGMA